jgi:hypothetical protein
MPFSVPLGQLTEEMLMQSDTSRGIYPTVSRTSQPATLVNRLGQGPDGNPNNLPIIIHAIIIHQPTKVVYYRKQQNTSLAGKN